MKPFTRFILGCALTAAMHTQAQADSTKTASMVKKWSREIGINLYSSTMRDGNYYSNYQSVYDHYAASGLYLKIFHGKSAIRTSVDYFQKITFERAQTAGNKSFSFKTLQFAAGYQRHFGNKNVMPYVFTDLSYGHGTEMVREWNGDCPTCLPIFPYVYNSPRTISTRAFSASPGIGLRLRLRKNMMVNIETGAEFFYMRQFETYRYNVPEIMGVNLKPLRCSFGLVF